jgi:putative DNA primase/helicase
MILVPFLVTIPPAEQDRMFVEKLKSELPGIFNWAIEGFWRLRQQGHFTESQVSRQALDDYRLESNPAKGFLLEHCVADANSTEPCANVYDLYRRAVGLDGLRPLDAKQFGKEVRKVFPSVERKKLTRGGGDRVWCYAGLKVTHDVTVPIYNYSDEFENVNERDSPLVRVVAAARKLRSGSAA